LLQLPWPKPLNCRVHRTIVVSTISSRIWNRGFSVRIGLELISMLENSSDNTDHVATTTRSRTRQSSGLATIKLKLTFDSDQLISAQTLLGPAS